MKYSTPFYPLVFCAVFFTNSTLSAETVLSGFVNPESVIAHPDGRIFITEIGEFGVAGDGKISVIYPDGRTDSLVEGLNDPKGIDFFNDALYVADVDHVVKVSMTGDIEILASAKDFPGKPVFLNDIEIDGDGNVYVSDSGQDDGQHAGIYRIAVDGQITEILTADSAVLRPNGLLMDGYQKLLIADFGTGDLYQLDIASGALLHLNSGFGQADGLVRDAQGYLYISDWGDGQVWQLVEPKATPHRLRDDFQTAADISISADGRYLLVPDMFAGTLTYLPIR